jgi:hypothetical protein
MSAVAKLLDRFERVKQTAAGRWLTACPCCQSRRGRPISVRELDDGRVLFHPFCGCEKGAVLGAIGLTLADLYPQRLPGHSYPATHSRIPARDLLEMISAEVGVVGMIAADMLAKKEITETDWARFPQAASRIHRARDYAYGR